MQTKLLQKSLYTKSLITLTRIIATVLTMGLFSIPLGIGQDDQIPMVLLVIGAIFFLTFIYFYLYRNKVFKNNKDKEKLLPCDEDANQKTEESRSEKPKKTSRKSKPPFIILVFKDFKYKKSYENTYSELVFKDLIYIKSYNMENYESGFLMGKIHYPFTDLDLNLRSRSVNGSSIQKHFWTWSMGRVYYVDEDINGELLWVWVRVHFYYPTPVATSLILPCSLSEDLSTDSIEMEDYVVLEYDANVEFFPNRTFSIIKIEKNRE